MGTEYITEKNKTSSKQHTLAKHKPVRPHALQSMLTQLQQSLGNRAVRRLFKAGVIQAKLKIGRPGDKYEQEANRVAEAVMRMPEPKVRRRKVEEEEEEEDLIQPKPLAEQITPLAQRRVGEQEEKRPEKTHFYRVKEGRVEIDFEAVAEALYHTLQVPESENEVLALLSPFAGEFSNIQKIKDAYKRQIQSQDDAALQNDLKNKLSGDGLKNALSLLHAPFKSTQGIARRLLAEAEQSVKPGGKCTIESFKRYVRAYLDCYLFNGQLFETERLRKEAPNSQEYKLAKEKLKKDLESLLGDSWGKKFLDGGPNGTDKQKVNALIGALSQPHLFGSKERAEGVNALWQIYKPTPTEKLPGAAKALEEEKLGEQLVLPWLQEEDIKKQNIRSILWDEVLKPGAIIQTYRDEACAPECGHSFIFVEYVYSPQEFPPKSRDDWELYGGSGGALDREGKEVTTRPQIKEMRSLHLVGMRIVDQHGYKFLAKKSKYTKPGSGRQGLAKSKLWFAAQLY